MKAKVEEAVKVLGMLGNQEFVTADVAVSEKDEGFYLSKNVVYLAKFVKEDTCVVSKLSNGVIQVLFNDHTQIAFWDSATKVCVVTNKGEHIIESITSTWERYLAIESTYPKLKPYLAKARMIFEKYSTVKITNERTNSSAIFKEVNRNTDSPTKVIRNEKVLYSKTWNNTLINNKNRIKSQACDSNTIDNNQCDMESKSPLRSSKLLVLEKFKNIMNQISVRNQNIQPRNHPLAKSYKNSMSGTSNRANKRTFQTSAKKSKKLN